MPKRKAKYESEDDDDLLRKPAVSAIAASPTFSSRAARAPVKRVKKEEPHSDDGDAVYVAPTASTSAAPVASSSNTAKGKVKAEVEQAQAPVPYIPRRASPSKRVRKDPDAVPEEKRLARVKKSCPKNIRERLERVRQQRFFLVDRERQGGELEEMFKVLGSTGNVYTIHIRHLPACDCPDAMKGNHCKHLLFVLLKVLNVPADSPSIYQKALLTVELEEIFANAPAAPSASVQHNGLQKAWAEATGSPVKSQAAAAPNGKRRLPEAGDTCPICFEDFDEDGADLSGIDFCETSCGGPVHKVCLAQWLNTKPEPTCIYCRAPWPRPAPGAGGGVAGGVAMDGQYLNLAGVAGISSNRDTSTYYHGPQRGMSQAQSYYSAAARYNGGRVPHAYDRGYYEGECWE